MLCETNNNNSLKIHALPEMTILLRMLGLADSVYGECRKEPSVVTAMRKVTGRWDEEEKPCAETKRATNEVIESNCISRLRELALIEFGFLIDALDNAA